VTVFSTDGFCVNVNPCARSNGIKVHVLNARCIGTRPHIPVSKENISKEDRKEI
jgi:hypothetical protein